MCALGSKRVKETKGNNPTIQLRKHQTMIYLILFFVFSTPLLIFTFMRPHPYRFSRFAAFESVLGLLFLGAEVWFYEPFSLRQIISWVLLLGSLVLAVYGFYMLRVSGEPDGDVENTTQLVTTGIYRYIRHPLYGSLILLGAGAFLKSPSFLGAGALMLLCLSAFITAKIEEEHNLDQFGGEYRVYMEKTKMFIPLLF
ncbi:MAG: isoprenylcysteine carboxylmethyltransferase family protein [Chloroflexota bacterium]|nr:MAG: isoprenylcysteine carboxylmethyltransferase family protein [Chloroflexota bacterium]